MASRKRTIGMAYAASGGAKVIGALVQLAALPIAARALGAENFGLLFTMAALASFPLIAMAGFSPAASVLVSRAIAAANDRLASAYFWSLLSWSVLSGVLLSAVTYFVLVLFDLPGAREGQLAIVFLLTLLANFAAGPIEGTRAAFGQAHYNSLFAILGSVVTLAMVLLPTADADTAYYFAAIYVAPVLAQLLNLLAFMVRHRKLGAPTFDRHIQKDIRTLFAANVQAQGGMVLYLHGGVYLLASLFGTGAVAIIGAFIRIAVHIHSMLLALFSPVLPTLTQAVENKDMAWLGRGLRNLAVLTACVLLAQAVVTLFAGPWIVRDVFKIEGGQGIGYYAIVALFVFTYSATHLLFVARLSVVQAAHGGGRILVAAVVGLIVAMLFAADDMVRFLAIQAIAMAAIAATTYGRELLKIARRAKQY